MKIADTTSRILQDSQQMMKILQQSQKTTRDMANKIIKMSVEQKVSQNKDQVTGALLDMYT